MSENRPINHPYRDAIVTRKDGVMIVEAAPPITDLPAVGPATPLQKAEAERIRAERRKEGEKRAQELQRRWDAAQAAKRA